MDSTSHRAIDDALAIVSVERRPRQKRLSVRLSDGSALSLTPDIAAAFRLASGQVLTPGRVLEFAAAQAREDAMAAALRLIALRPRSEKEMRGELAGRRVTGELQDEIMARLRELRLLDDDAFAAFFVDSRQRSSPRSRRLLTQELRQRGIDGETARASAGSVDNAEAAYQAACRRAGSLCALPFADFERRLGTYLLRRGFSFQTSRATVRRLWQEITSARPDE